MKRTLLVMISLTGSFLSYGQCDITGPEPVMCVTDAPVALIYEDGVGEFTGPGVVDGVFNPAEAGVGTHTIHFETVDEGDSYTVSEGVFSPDDITDGTSVFMSDDYPTGDISIGFTFNFFGNDFTQLKIHDNGLLLFSGPDGYVTWSPSALPTPSSANNLIAFCWGDMKMSNGGIVRYKTIGDAPNQVFIVEFFEVSHYYVGNYVTQQIKLFEGSNKIEIHTTSLPGGGNHIMGIENADGSVAYTVPGRNDLSWTATNDMWMFSPFVPCSSDIEIEVVASPTVTATVSAEEICLGEELTITAGGTADEYSLGAGKESGVPFTPSMTGENVFIVAGTDTEVGCVAATSISVFVHDIPFVSAGTDATICSDEEYTLYGMSEDEGVIFSWDNGIVDGEPFTQDPGSVTYTVTGTNEGDCEASASVTIESLEAPGGTGVVTMMTGMGYDGSIDFTPEGGTGGPYTFSWSNGAETEDVSGLTVGTYTVTVSDGQCDSEVTFVVDSQVGIEKAELENLKIYPNPIVEIFTIEFDGVYNWEIYDESGKIVMNGQGTNKTFVTAEELTAGVYYIHVSSGDKLSIISLIKE